MSIYKKLLEIQKSVRGLAKDKDGHGYKYVSGDKILSHVREQMDTLGVILKPEVLEITNVRQEYIVNGTKWVDNKKVEYPKSKVEILSTLKMQFTWICVETETFDIAQWASNGQNDFDKGVGSALTYAERYFLLKYFHISTDEDDIDALPPKEVATTDEEGKKSKSLSTDQAKSLIASANTLEELTAIYNTNQHLHIDKEFTTALTNRKLDLKNNQ